jgi:uncharacterized protein DUF5076
MVQPDDPRIYHALALPADALDEGGTEILRVGIVKDVLYVTALPVFKDLGKWGVVLADVAARLGAIHAAKGSGLSKKDVAVQIAEAFAAEMGARPVKTKATPRAAKKTAKRRAAKRKKR